LEYLSYFIFPGKDKEDDYLWDLGNTCSYYPFRVLSKNNLKRMDFDPITILYGGNGSGKSTALNIIAEKLKVERDSMFNKTIYFEDFVDMCKIDILDHIPKKSKIITSDDVFDFMLDIRNLNEGIVETRKAKQSEFLNAKYSDFKFRTMADYDELKKVNQARSKSQTKYVNREVMKNIETRSNGENAFQFFIEKIEENGLYILDEPENSLSPKRQKELKKFIEDSARFFGCQFIISTHSPFILSIKNAKIYDLDLNPVETRKWTDLENVKIYYEFFNEYRDEFK
jgi:Predicted ATPase